MESIPDEERKLLEGTEFEEEMLSAIKKDLDLFPNDVDDNMIERLGKLMASTILPNDEENILTEDELKKIENTNHFIIKVDKLKEDYSLAELLSLCNLEQLKLYYKIQNINFYTTKKDKVGDKNKLINQIKKDILSNFKAYLPICRGCDIQLFESFVNNSNNFNEIEDEYIIAGYIFQIKKERNIHYIMPKELKDIIKKTDFNKTSINTINYCTNLIKTLVMMKGIVSKDEAYQILIDLENYNIKEEDIDKIITNNFKQKDEFFYIDGTIDKKIFDKLVKVKENIPYITSSDEIIDYQIMIDHFFDIITFLSKKEFNEEIYYKNFFYEPKDSEQLIKYIKKEFNIKNDKIEIIEEFLYSNMFDFHYWIYNGDTIDEDVIDEILDSEFDDPFGTFM